MTVPHTSDSVFDVRGFSTCRWGCPAGTCHSCNSCSKTIASLNVNYRKSLFQRKNEGFLLHAVPASRRGGGAFSASLSGLPLASPFFSIDPGYRGELGKVMTQYQNLIDSNDIFHEGFYVPENVYIIGTMNDIDRSMESMDFAMRRRFTFREITATERQYAILGPYNEEAK